MCVQRGLYPLVELDDNKRKVLLDYGMVIENRDFSNLNIYSLEWNKAIKDRSVFYSFNRAAKKYGIKSFIKYVNIPCGHCEECNKSKSRSWAFRILKEAEKYNNNFFITFTYDDEFLPMVRVYDNYVNTLIYDEISKFNKKLKTYLKRKGLNSTFRFYGVGEYGSKTLRPHYHVIYFNLDIPDLE